MQEVKRLRRQNQDAKQASYFVTHSIGYDSLDVTPEEIIKNVTHQIKDCCATISSKLHFVGHSFMRYDEDVAEQTIHFLKIGKFGLIHRFGH